MAKPRKKPNVSAGLAVGRKLNVAQAMDRDSDPPRETKGSGAEPLTRRKARYACMCKVKLLHGAWNPCLVLWEGSDKLEVVPRQVAERATFLTLDMIVVEANPWRALTEEDIADIWRLAPPGSIIRPIHAGRAASLLVECPDGSFSHITASPIVDNIPGAMRLAYGDAAPADTWVLKRPVHIDR